MEPDSGNLKPASPQDKKNGRGPKLQSKEGEPNPQDAHRMIPHSPEAEKGVLSCMLQAPNECVSEATVKLGADHFFSHGRRTLFEAILKIHDEGRPVDLISLTTYLKDRNQLDLAGGWAEVAEILNFAPAAAHFEYYAGIVLEKHILREIIRTGNENIARAYGERTEEKRGYQNTDDDEIASVDILLDKFEQDVLKIRESVEGKDRIRTMRDHLMEVIQEIEEMFQNRGKTKGISTGFPDYDSMTSGLHPGEMTIIAARPSMGKTSFAMNIVEHVALNEKLPVAVFSLEMTSQSLVMRLLCSQAGVPMNKIRDGMLSQQRDFPKIQHAAARLAESKIFIDDTASLSIMALRAKARRLKKQHNVALIAVDYLQLMRSESRKAKDSRQQEVAEVSAGLKALAKELKIPVVVLAQLNRSPDMRESNRPRLSDLRESGSIEQDADVVGLLMREGYYAENEQEKEEAGKKAVFIIAKQRNGATGDVLLTFRDDLMRFESRSREDDGER